MIALKRFFTGPWIWYNWFSFPKQILLIRVPQEYHSSSELEASEYDLVESQIIDFILWLVRISFLASCSVCLKWRMYWHQYCLLVPVQPVFVFFCIYIDKGDYLCNLMIALKHFFTGPWIWYNWFLFTKQILLIRVPREYHSSSELEASEYDLVESQIIEIFHRNFFLNFEVGCCHILHGCSKHSLHVFVFRGSSKAS